MSRGEACCQPASLVVIACSLRCSLGCGQGAPPRRHGGSWGALPSGAADPPPELPVQVRSSGAAVQQHRRSGAGRGKAQCEQGRPSACPRSPCHLCATLAPARLPVPTQPKMLRHPACCPLLALPRRWHPLACLPCFSPHLRRGVIVGWDPTCRASEDWMQQMGVDRLPGEWEGGACRAGDQGRRWRRAGAGASVDARARSRSVFPRLLVPCSPSSLCPSQLLIQ